MPEDMRVLFLSSEMTPFAKTGGLADVAGALPPALKRLGVDVRAVLPLYRQIRRADWPLRTVMERFCVPLGEMSLETQVLETKAAEDLPVYLIEREDLFERPNLYGTGRGDYYDNLERFTFFVRAALETARRLQFRPHVVHCHDWQTGLAPALMRCPQGEHAELGKAAILFTIHNLAYQGLFPPHKLALTGLDPRVVFHPEGLEFWGRISLLKAGVVYADAISTVSPGYAREIQTPEFGMGFDGLLRKRAGVLKGILNGVDYEKWNPLRDPHIAANYSLGKLILRTRCKAALMEECGLAPRLLEKPLVAMITRLDAQKGLDLLIAALEELMHSEAGLIVLGSGDVGIQDSLQEAARLYPGRMRMVPGFDEPLAHRILAGADLLLMPSRYEPCGLTQMYALRYGCVPVVRGTGGLEDTVSSFDPSSGRGTGFKFYPYEPGALTAALRQAFAIFRQKSLWQRLMINGMQEDFSWKRSARAYLELYRELHKQHTKGKTSAAKSSHSTRSRNAPTQPR